MSVADPGTEQIIVMIMIVTMIMVMIVTMNMIMISIKIIIVKVEQIAGRCHQHQFLWTANVLRIGDHCHLHCSHNHRR